MSDGVLLECVAGLGWRATNCRGPWLVQVQGQELLAACSAERWCARSTRHCGRAVEHSSSLLVVLELLF